MSFDSNICCTVCFVVVFAILLKYWSTFYALQTAYSHSQLPQKCEMLYLINQTTIVVLLSNCQQLGFETMFEVWLCNLWGRTVSLHNNNHRSYFTHKSETTILKTHSKFPKGTYVQINVQVGLQIDTIMSLLFIKYVQLYLLHGSCLFILSLWITHC